jgi:hypothetical protein
MFGDDGAELKKTMQLLKVEDEAIPPPAPPAEFLTKVQFFSRE